MPLCQVQFERYKSFTLYNGKIDGLKSTSMIDGIPRSMQYSMDAHMEDHNLLADRELLKKWYSGQSSENKYNLDGEADPSLIWTMFQIAMNSSNLFSGVNGVRGLRNKYEKPDIILQDNTEPVLERYLYVFRHEGSQQSTDGTKDFIRIEREIEVDRNGKYLEIDIEEEYKGDMPEDRKFPTNGADHVMFDEDFIYYIWMSDHQLTVNRLEYLRRFMQNALEYDYPPGKVDFSRLPNDLINDDNSSGNLLRFGKAQNYNNVQHYSILLHDYNYYCDLLIQKAQKYENKISEVLKKDFDGNTVTDNEKLVVLGLVYRTILGLQPMKNDGSVDPSLMRKVRRYCNETNNSLGAKSNIIEILEYQRCIQLIGLQAQALMIDPRFSETIVDSFFTFDIKSDIKIETDIKSELAILLGLVAQTTEGMKTIQSMYENSKPESYTAYHDNVLKLREDRDFCYNYRETVDHYDRLRLKDQNNTYCPLPALHWMSEFSLKNTNNSTNDDLDDANGALISFIMLISKEINSNKTAEEQKNEVWKILKGKIPDVIIKTAEDLGKNEGIIQHHPSKATLFKNGAEWGGALKLMFDYYSAFSKLNEDFENIDTWLTFTKVNLEVAGKFVGEPADFLQEQGRRMVSSVNRSSIIRSMSGSAKRKLFLRSFLKYAPVGIDIILEFKSFHTNFKQGQNQLIALNITSLALIGLAVAFPAAWLLFIVTGILVSIMVTIFRDTYPEVFIQYTFIGHMGPSKYTSDEKDGRLEWNWHGEGPEYKLIEIGSDNNWTEKKQVAMFGYISHLIEIKSWFLSRENESRWGATIIQISLPHLVNGVKIQLSVEEIEGSLWWKKNRGCYLDIELKENNNCRILFHENKYHVFVFLHNNYEEHTFSRYGDLWKKKWMGLRRDTWAGTWEDDLERRSSKMQRFYNKMVKVNNASVAHQWGMANAFSDKEKANLEIIATVTLPNASPMDLKLQHSIKKEDIPVGGKKDDDELEDFDGNLGDFSFWGIGDGLIGEFDKYKW